MAYIEIKGNIFNSKAMAIVNTVNCVGAMGKGIALEYKLRFPDMFAEYQKVCFARQLRPGQILPYRKSSPWILNFAIKDEWKDPSRPEWIEETLIKFVKSYQRMGITSIAFPWMGAMNGGLNIEIIKSLTRSYLNNLPNIDIEVYEFDPHSPDPLFLKLYNIISENAFSIIDIAKLSDIKERYWIKIFDTMKCQNIYSMTDLCNFRSKGKRVIGKTNIERLYNFLSGENSNRGSISNSILNFIE